jgi:O-antigen/teichoic acid export membrane protein
MENAEKNTTESNQLIVRRFYELAILFAFVGIGVAYFTEEALVLLTTTEFHDAKYLTPLLVVYYLMGILGFLSVNQLMFAEKLAYNFPASALGLGLNILLNMLLIPVYGAMGAVISTAISTTLIAIVLFYFSNRVHPLPINYTKLIQLFVIVVVYTLLIYPVFYFDLWFVWKILIKALLLLSFIIVSIKLKYITNDVIKSTFLTMVKFNFK